MESLVQEKLWLSPAHHRTNGSMEQEDSTISLDSLGNSDVQDETILTPVVRKDRNEPQASYYSQHYKHHRRDRSINSNDSTSVSSVNVRLHGWEQKIVDQVFPGPAALPVCDKQDKASSSVSSTSLSPGLTNVRNCISVTSKGKPVKPHLLLLSSSPRHVDLDRISPVQKRLRTDNVAPFENCDTMHRLVAKPLSLPASSNEIRNLVADFRANAGVHMPVAIKTTRIEVEVANGILKPDIELSVQEEDEESSFPYNALVPASTPGMDPPDCFNPAHHQHIHVLFSSHSTQSPNAPYPCVLPWVVDIDFYRGNDITVGGFLERYCFRPSYHCPNESCGRPMVEHVRSFVHGNTCLTIVIKELSKPFHQSSIFTWTWDHLSRKSSEIKTMSHDVWSMSFAKYLELRLEDLDIPRAHSNSRPQGEKQTLLDMDLELSPFTSFQYFLYRDIVAAFKCFPVNINEVVFPSLTLQPSPREDNSFHTCQLSDDAEMEEPTNAQFSMTLKMISEKSYEVLDTILDCVNAARTNRSGGTSDPPSEESQAARDRYFEAMTASLNQERSQMREDLDAVQMLLHKSRLVPSLPLLGSNGASDDRDDVSEPPEENFILSKEMARDLSLRILRLKCDICQIVQSWNESLVETNDRERSGKWISNGTESPQPPRKMISNPQMIIPEESHTDDQSWDGLMMNPGSPGNRSINNSTETDYPHADSSANNSEKVPSSTRQSFSRKSRTSLSSDSRSFEKSTSFKRMSRTGSSVRLLVTRLLPGNTLIPSIPMPYPSDEHYLLPECVTTNVIVRDAEPASIIAYALSSNNYKQATATLLADDELASEATSVDMEAQVFLRDDASNTSAHSASPLNIARPPDNHADVDGIRSDLQRSMESKYSRKVSDTLTKGSSQQSTPTNSPHVELQFSDPTTKFYCKVYFASMFENLRAKILEGGEAQYLASMSRSVRWVARGGKSGSTFHKTRDDQFILKQMSYFELQSFLEFAPKYVAYITKSIDNQETTTISKILGVYRISFRNSESNRSLKQDVLVIENLFYRRKISQIFDLKGSVRNRNVKVDNSNPAPDPGCSAEHNDVVLLDENLLKLMCDNPLYVHEHTKHLLKNAIARDTNFLSSHLIMDYSLLAGVDDNNQIVVGIIDYIRTFTWDKKLEMVVKSYGMFGGRKQSNRSMPTVVSPELYKSRFCEAMDRYFLVVPDRWYGMHAY